MADEIDGLKFEQQHGKSRVRVARVWRKEDGRHFFVEWNVNISLLSDCLSAYGRGNNSDIVATDTMKNTVYVKAKECVDALSVEDFAIELGRHFTSFYQQVTAAIIKIVEKPWERVYIDGQPHEHGFVRDEYTALPETRERMLATEVSALWRYHFESLSSIPAKPLYFTEKFLDVKKVLISTFFGHVKGVYSPSVQSTLYDMARAVLNRFPDISSINLRMPNLHFLPANISSKDNPAIVKFDDDVYIPTDEPHGTIQASLSRSWSRM
ncbi:PREDICTED: uricase-2-like isoform X2 [Nelumbo nucifera]|uniref:Uricase n=2 Tax=Nelumbo nucifera TaxID=4432 RepID=A0A822YBP5_NELNU|nr:PREDICTED: uricase-2-like isoform X2 [Nelumbo nucifera]DAD28941.1 TPA_asm: hypothetical protein HUJ06_030409 [Nelumbo nucifera]